MIKTKLIIRNKLNNIPKTKRKDFLLNCLDKFLTGKYVLNDEDNDDKGEDEIIDEKKLFCELCNSYDFLRDKYTETCQSCGLIRNLDSTQKTYEKIEYIKPGSNIVKMFKDGKYIRVDLNKINLWLQDTDPLAIDTQKIIENLNTIFQSRGLDLPINIQNTSISLWYNFNTLYEKNYPISKKYNKKAILCLCIYYGGLINKSNISLEQLSLLFDINISEIISSNNIFKKLFEETEYYQYLQLKESNNCDIKLSPKNQLIMKKIIEDLKLMDPTFKMTNKEYASIIYYITNKINPLLKFTLKDLSEKCKISTTSIADYSKKIENYYKRNKNKYYNILL